MEKTKHPVLTTAIMLFALGFFGRIALHDYHNIETIMVSIFLASMLLPGSAAAVVSISMIVLSDIYLGYFGNSKIILFTYTGFLLVSLVTTKLKNKIGGKYSARTVYKFTASGIIFTAVFDTWTNFGVFWLGYEHTINNLAMVFILGIPFMIYHLLSSIVTFTIIGFPLYQALTSKTSEEHAINLTDKKNL